MTVVARDGGNAGLVRDMHPAVLLWVRAAFDRHAVVVAVKEGPERDDPRGEEERDVKVGWSDGRVPELLAPLRDLCWCCAVKLAVHGAGVEEREDEERGDGAWGRWLGSPRCGLINHKELDSSV